MTYEGKINIKFVYTIGMWNCHVFSLPVEPNRAGITHYHIFHWSNWCTCSALPFVTLGLHYTENYSISQTVNEFLLAVILCMVRWTLNISSLVSWTICHASLEKWGFMIEISCSSTSSGILSLSFSTSVFHILGPPFSTRSTAAFSLNHSKNSTKCKYYYVL